MSPVEPSPLNCCACQSNQLHVTDGNGCPAVRCLTCNVKMIITNQSDLKPEQRSWLWRYQSRWNYKPRSIK